MDRLIKLIVFLTTAVYHFLCRGLFMPSYLFNTHEGIKGFQLSANQTVILAVAYSTLIAENQGVIVGDVVAAKVDGGIRFIPLDSLKKSNHDSDEIIENGTLVYIKDNGELDKTPTVH
jgi:hypothetical protein